MPRNGLRLRNSGVKLTAIRRELLARVPSRVLVELNRHPAIKRVLRERLSTPPAPAGTIQQVTLRAGPAVGRRMLLDMGSDERRIGDGHLRTMDQPGPARHRRRRRQRVGHWRTHRLLRSRADALSPSGRHLVVEPAPNVQQRLRANLELNDVASVSIAEIAVSDTTGSVRFVVDENTAISRVDPTADDAIDVPMVALDRCSTVTLRRTS